MHRSRNVPFTSNFKRNDHFSIENHPFSGAISHSFCTFNGKFRKQLAFILHFAVRSCTYSEEYICHTIGPETVVNWRILWHNAFLRVGTCTLRSVCRGRKRENSENVSCMLTPLPLWSPQIETIICQFKRSFVKGRIFLFYLQNLDILLQNLNLYIELTTSLDALSPPAILMYPYILPACILWWIPKWVWKHKRSIRDPPPVRVCSPVRRWT